MEWEHYAEHYRIRRGRPLLYVCGNPRMFPDEKEFIRELAALIRGHREDCWWLLVKKNPM